MDDGDECNNTSHVRKWKWQIGKKLTTSGKMLQKLPQRVVWTLTHNTCICSLAESVWMELYMDIPDRSDTEVETSDSTLQIFIYQDAYGMQSSLDWLLLTLAGILTLKVRSSLHNFYIFNVSYAITLSCGKFRGSGFPASGIYSRLNWTRVSAMHQFSLVLWKVSTWS